MSISLLSTAKSTSHFPSFSRLPVRSPALMFSDVYTDFNTRLRSQTHRFTCMLMLQHKETDTTSPSLSLLHAGDQGDTLTCGGFFIGSDIRAEAPHEPFCRWDEQLQLFLNKLSLWCDAGDRISLDNHSGYMLLSTAHFYACMSSAIVRHMLACLQGCAFIALAAASARAWRGPGAAYDLICLWKVVFSFIQAVQGVHSYLLINGNS